MHSRDSWLLIVIVIDGPMANDVTVNVMIDGLMVYSETRAIEVEDHDEYFCEIEMPLGVVTGL